MVAGVLVREGQVLLGRRSAAKQWYPGVWDLPGGHVEPGELPVAALVRELAEELGIAVGALTGPVAHVPLPDGTLAVWRVDDWDGTVTNAAPEEHDEVRWFGLDEALALDLAHPSYAALLRELLGQER